MDVSAIQQALRAFIQQHSTTFHRLGDKKSQLLELGALAVSTEHYSLLGYDVRPKNIKNGVFRAKLGSRGYPWNFSYFHCEKAAYACEIHANLPVYGGHDDRGIYVVDIAIVDVASVPRAKRHDDWEAVDNSRLITFLEAKRLVVYPMLLAQFVGIVHEIKPQFLGGRRPWGFIVHGHFDPSLVVVGYMSARATRVCDSFDRRGFKIRVVPTLDTEIARLRTSPLSVSPLAL